MGVLNKRFAVLLLVTVCAGIFSVFSTASAGTIRKPPTNLNLTGYWPMNEEQGTIVGDASGNRRDLRFNTGISVTNPTWTNGKRNRALNFDGVGASLFRKDNATLPAATTLISTATGTVSVWVRPAASGVEPIYIYESPAIVADSLGYFGIHQASLGGDDRLWAYNYDTGEAMVGFTYTPGEWVHITWMHASSTLYVYKNGVLEDSTPSGNTGTLGTAFRVGKSFGNTYFSGDIDELRTYNRPLTDSEIMRLYQTGAVTIGRINKSPGTLATGLKGHWTFDGKDMQQNVADMSGTGNNGKLSGQTSTTTIIGKIGQALDFDGTDDYVNAGSSSGLKPGSGVSFTASLWYKGAGDGTKYFIGAPSTAAQSFWYVGESGTQFFSTSESTLGTVVSYTLPSDNDWHHLVVTLDRSTSPDTVTAYIDGVSVGSATEVGGMDGATAGGSGGTYIGRGYWAAPGAYRQGPMDDVRIYNRALSASEIKQLYLLGGEKVAKTTTPTGTLTSGIIAHYTFDGKDMYQNVADVSGGGNHGALFGQAATTTAIGKIGQALNFDGTDDYVKVSHATLFDLSDFSYSVWVNPAISSGAYKSIIDADDDKQLLSINEGRYEVYGRCSGVGGTAKKNEWHHLVWTVSGTSYVLYEDGVQIKSGSGCSSSINAGAIHIGAGVFMGAPNEAFNGKIDDVRIYNRALSASEAKQLYLLGK